MAKAIEIIIITLYYFIICYLWLRVSRLERFKARDILLASKKQIVRLEKALWQGTVGSL